MTYLTLNLSSICVEEAVADNKKEEENKKKSTEKIPKDFKKSIPKKIEIAQKLL